ncbi:hypothetical protein N825_09235 [Skermanella stibiiresistens SB22]|uniref:DUF5615 domain-containing protein n=1 Tax=Skermanella stibiiresistens SB22 TaxID=1385369 RepID=W9H1X3_9PROT|nr:DUF5615 family PIN-like protein [Skermanella stibiiresistens]EWY37753.1 hypothetical protein N825_09235 [Skermanella stibiiresistens SB22]
MKYRFLIDANLTPQLEGSAWAYGHEAYHVRTLGRENDGDPVLLKLVEAEGYTLVTNNIEEFRTRYRNRQVFHAGVVFIADATRGRAYQLAAFGKALAHIASHGPIDNMEILIEPDPIAIHKVTSAQLP